MCIIHNSPGGLLNLHNPGSQGFEFEPKPCVSGRWVYNVARPFKSFPTWLIKLSEVLSESAAAPPYNCRHGSAATRDIPARPNRPTSVRGLSDKLFLPFPPIHFSPHRSPTLGRAFYEAAPLTFHAGIITFEPSCV